MPLGVGSVAVLVTDAKKSAQWYHDVLGFQIVGAEQHAVFVRPRDSTLPLLHLCEECDSWKGDRPGGPTGVWFHCGPTTFHRAKSGEMIPTSDPAEVERTYHELKERGVEFTEELRSVSWGKTAVFRDPDGNEFEIS